MKYMKYISHEITFLSSVHFMGHDSMPYDDGGLASVNVKNTHTY
jgi:hypothetical protein